MDRNKQRIRLKNANLLLPKIYKNPKDIDRPVIIKFHRANVLKKVLSDFSKLLFIFSSTERPRSCGCLDLELFKFTSQINSFTESAITNLDVLDSYD